MTALAMVGRGGRLFVLRDAGLILLVVAVVSLLANALRPHGLPLVARQEYETLVPCPEPGGPVTALTPSDPLLLASDTLVVDAGLTPPLAGFAHVVRVPYDYLEPTAPAAIAGLIKAATHSAAKRIVVVGDGEAPDSGEQLGKELAGAGIKEVLFVKGGAPALGQR
jgi:hypothetical protein